MPIMDTQDTEYLEQLNDAQREAVEYLQGPSLVIAGAGSGKTRVLTYKIVHLLRNGFDPHSILALTFTNKAAREMKERVAALVGEREARRLWMGTFHSIFLRILRVHSDKLGFKSSFTIYDASDSRSLIKLIIKDLALNDKDYKPAVIASIISNAKNALISPEQYMRDRDYTEADAKARRPLTGRIYSLYCERCRLADAMDFDDILVYMNVLLRDFPEVAEYYQDFFSYILVDEYQDTNFAQNLIVTTLSKKNRALCAVGDDAQSIYSFRGANIANILSMEERYQDLKIFKLERNYRSTRNIINAAGSLIAHNKKQIRKNVYSENKQGAPVEITEAFSDIEEANLTATAISRQINSTHDAPDTFAVLYRTNSQSRLLEEALRNRNIPYRIYGGITFYQRKEVKDAICYMRLAVNPSDDEALRRVINFPTRGIGETTMKKIQAEAIAKSVSLWDVISNPEQYVLNVNSGTLKKLSAFTSIVRNSMVDLASGKDAYEVAAGIYQRSGLSSLYAHDATPEEVSKRENLAELLRGVNDFVESQKEAGSPEIGLSDYLSQISLATDQDQKEDSDIKKVTLMTVHAAKGLEFKHICIVGLEENLFPSSLSVGNPAEVEEERRLLYVAITRAMETCRISYARSRFRNGETQAASPSRFLYELQPDFIKVSSASQLASSRGNIYSSKPMINGNFRQLNSTFTHSSGRDALAATSTNATVSTPSATPSGNYRIIDRSEVEVGTIVRHQKFGQGEVVSTSQVSNEFMITVKFETAGERKLILRFAKLEIIKQ